MRALRTLDDVKLVLKEIMVWYDSHRTKDWNFNRLRIKNASPSVDDYDYVVRKELVDTVGQFNESDRYYTVVFSNAGTPTVADDASAPFIVPRNGDGIMILAYAVALTAPSGGAFTSFIVLNGTRVHSTALTVPNGSTAVDQEARFTSTISVEENDLINVDITAVNSAAKVTIEVTILRKKTLQQN